jgi:hypothetical protein
MKRTKRLFRRRPDPDDREVLVGILPMTPTKSAIGVMIRRGDDERVMPPDEARALAEEMEVSGEPADLVARLRDVAEKLPMMVRELAASGPGLGCTVVGPRQTGPHALRSWVVRHHRAFRAAWLRALDLGAVPSDVILMATPGTESMDDPPLAVEVRSRRDASPPDGAPATYCDLVRTAAEGAPPEGFFDIVASAGSGRFKGTTHCQLMLEIPGSSGPLPRPPLIVGDVVSDSTFN